SNGKGYVTYAQNSTESGRRRARCRNANAHHIGDVGALKWRSFVVFRSAEIWSSLKTAEMSFYSQGWSRWRSLFGLGRVSSREAGVTIGRRGFRTSKTSW